jgi:hypothetical protein
VHPRQEDVEVERLRQVIVGAGGEAAEHVLRLPPGRQHENREQPSLLAELGGHRKAIAPRQHHVEHHEIDARVGREPVEGRLAGGGGLRDVPLGFEVEAEAVGQVLFVFDDEDAAHAAGSRGSCSVKVLPWPGPSLSANTRPPCLRATELTMKSPSPVPLTRKAISPGIR